jgi:hypothetical protein
LSAEYAAQKKELDERARQWLEKRREKGEAPEMDEREREREKQERKALRLRLFGGAEASVEGSSDDETASNGGDKKGTRQARALSVLIKKHGDDDGEDGDEKEKKRSESTYTHHTSHTRTHAHTRTHTHTHAHVLTKRHTDERIESWRSRAGVRRAAAARRRAGA